MSTKYPSRAPRDFDRPPRVMVVDDDGDIRQLLKMVLELEGFEVVGLVADGSVAVDVAFETQPDVIVLDYMMPNMDGASAATFLRQVAPHAFVIGFSGAVLEEDCDWADEFVGKGGVGTIAEVVRRAMATRRVETNPVTA
jgi:CheY-like chemotaxis protein